MLSLHVQWLSSIACIRKQIHFHVVYIILLTGQPIITLARQLPIKLIGECRPLVGGAAAQCMDSESYPRSASHVNVPPQEEGYSNTNIGRFRENVQPVCFSYTIFERERHPFHTLSIENCTFFTCLERGYYISFLSFLHRSNPLRGVLLNY